MAETYCPVCGSAGVEIQPTPRTSRYVQCTRCGRYEITLLLNQLFDAQSAEFVSLRPYLSAYLRQATEGGESPTITTDNWEALASAHRHTPVPRKLETLLRLIGQRSDGLGRTVSIDPDDFVLLDAADVNEMSYLLDALVEQDAVRQRVHLGYVVTPKGWERLAPIAPGGTPGTCFVAMSFDPSLNPAFSDGIFPAVQTDCGFQLVRVDRTPHNDNITDRIIAGIRSAQFVVADFTLQRQGVYYEAGFAQGLGRTVIRICRDSDFDNLHFDTRQYFHLKWHEPADLRISLADHIRATIETARQAGA
jgi:hypothetical protein